MNQDKVLAVVVGIERYDTGWKLDGPASDASRFVDWLITQGVPPGNISMFVSPLPDNAHLVQQQAARGVVVADANHASITRHLVRDLPRQSCDRLLLNWGGHGFTDSAGELRLICADAESDYLLNVNLDKLLKMMRTNRYGSHRSQLVVIDSCRNYGHDRDWAAAALGDTYPEDLERVGYDQQVLFAASPGERALNDNANKTGLFSKVVMEEITWPPEPEDLRDRVHDRFEELREKRITRQIPSHLWFRSRRGGTTLVFSTDAGALAAPLGASLLKYDDFRTLRRILRSATVTCNLRSLHREVTRNIVGLPSIENADDLMSVVENLRQPLDAYPLFTFLVHFAASTDTVARAQIWEWVEAVAPSHKIEIEALRTLGNELRRTVLLVRLEPDLIDSGFQVTVWRYVGEDGRQEVSSDVPWSTSRLCAALAELVDGFDPDHDDVAPLIEFMVPKEMLGLNLESLRVRIAGRDRELGTACPVVVRPIERLSATASRELHLAKWSILTERCGSYNSEAIHWLDIPPDPNSITLDNLHERACVALTYARSGVAPDDAVLGFLLGNGTPVAVWHRTTDAQPQRKLLERVLHGKALRDLPDIVRDQREAACHPIAPADHAGRELVLMWDDPTRVPEDLRWQPPVLEGTPQ